jgi:signal transduction histidine kinase
VLRAVASELQPGFSMKGITLNLRFFADSNVKIWSDKEHFERLFVILLGNALKFTDQGTVALEVTIEDMADNYNHLQISVTDSGVGIPEGMLEQIFEPFIQGDGSHTRRHGGIGLGLAIAQQNAMILNGKLRAEHVLTGGSSFKFSMKTITIQ